MEIILFGASGMIGKGVLLECLEDSRITRVLAIGRHSCGVRHGKLTEILREDFLDYTDIRNDLRGYDACFYCLGISSVGMSEEKYIRITHDFTLAAAKVLVAQNQGITFCFVSGMGTDSTEKGKSMWARVKGRTENELLKIPFRSVLLFRPGYIQPMKGVRSKVGWYQALYVLFKPLYPLLKRMFPNAVTSTVNIGKAMINGLVYPPASPILTPAEINKLAAK